MVEVVVPVACTVGPPARSAESPAIHAMTSTATAAASRMCRRVKCRGRNDSVCATEASWRCVVAGSLGRARSLNGQTRTKHLHRHHIGVGRTPVNPGTCPACELFAAAQHPVTDSYRVGTQRVGRRVSHPPPAGGENEPKMDDVAIMCRCRHPREQVGPTATTRRNEQV